MGGVNPISFGPFGTLRRIFTRTRPYPQSPPSAARDPRQGSARRDDDRLPQPAGDPPPRAVPRDERAGIPRVGPTGEKRTFHSLRHTFARIAIEHNRPIFWLSKHLGHSSLDVTSNVYGHFEKATRRREAEAMAGVFGV